jgi:hypothetical protein
MSLKFVLVCISMAVSVCTLEPRLANAQVWPIKKSAWTSVDEAAFSSWVEAATKGEPESLFKAGRPLAILGTSPVDCADFVYALRIIFASENGLPFFTKAPKLEKVVNSKRADWNHLPANDRLRAFLRLAFSELSTRTLPFDTYPIRKLSRQSLQPGTILLAAPEIGHSWVIRKVRDTGIPELVFGSVPDRTEVYFHQGLPRGEAVFGKTVALQKTSAGFRAWTESNSSADDQGSSPPPRANEWRTWALRVLAVRPEPLVEAASRQLQNICREVRLRAKLVLEANALRAKGCLSKRDQYDFSTPNRDSRLKEGFLDLWEVWMTANDFLDETRQYRRGVPNHIQAVLDQIDQVFSNRSIDPLIEDIVCPVNVLPEETVSLRDIRATTIGGRLSVDPNESVRARWGLEGETGECRVR